MNINKLTRNAVFATVAAGGLYAASAIKIPKNDVSADIKKTEAPANPVQMPVTAGTLFTLGLFGRKKKNEDDVLLSKEEQEAKAAAEAGMSVEKYRSLFEPTSKCDFMKIHSFSDGYRYFNTAREWLFQHDEKYEPNINSIQSGFKIMDKCFEQYEKENIKIFEEEDKARCKKLMAEVNEAIEKGEEIEDDKLNELVFIYDKKRLYPYI